LPVTHIRQALETLFAAGAISAAVYYVLCLWSVAAFLTEQKHAGEGARATLPPAVSILKPLKGTDPEMYESFRSHCLQNYTEYEIIFGVSDANDPAIELVESLKREFPQHAIRLIVCGKDLGANTKVSNLAQMLPEAQFEHIIVNDSDIRVQPDYLPHVTAPLSDPQVGLVTCLYRGIANQSLGSKLESLGISTDFAAGVLVARQLEGIKFGLGSTLAFRRSDLAAIGGFESLVGYLADDYELGKAFAERGRQIELSQSIVETFLPYYSVGEFLRHQLRWARTIRDSRFAGYVGLGLTFGIPWALLTLILAGGAAWAGGLLAVVLALRLLVAFMVGMKVLRDRQTLRFFWLIPLRDLLALFVWMASFFGHTISWRGDKFKVEKGKLIRT